MLAVLPFVASSAGSPYGVNAHLARPIESIEKTASLCREAGIGCVRERAVLMKGKVRNWEIWNEQNLRGFWPHANPANWFAFLKAAYGILKEVDPQNRVVIGGFAGRPYPYLEELYSLGAKDFFDIMNFHTYPEHSIRNVAAR